MALHLRSEFELKPVSPAFGWSDEPTEGQTSRPRREGPGGSEGSVRGRSARPPFRNVSG